MKKDIYRKRLFIFLFVYFALFSSYYMTDTFTKCVGQLNKGAATSIAKWDVSVDSNDASDYNVIIGNTTQNLESQTYTFTVTSNSEVGVNYSITLSNVPTGVQVIFDNVTYNESNNVVTISNAGSFTASAVNNTHTHSFTFVAPAGVANALNNDVDIDVDFVQSSL